MVNVPLVGASIKYISPDTVYVLSAVLHGVVCVVITLMSQFATISQSAIPALFAPRFVCVNEIVPSQLAQLATSTTYISPTWALSICRYSTRSVAAEKSTRFPQGYANASITQMGVDDELAECEVAPVSPHASASSCVYHVSVAALSLKLSIWQVKFLNGPQQPKSTSPQSDAIVISRRPACDICRYHHDGLSK